MGFGSSFKKIASAALAPAGIGAAIGFSNTQSALGALGGAALAKQFGLNPEQSKNLQQADRGQITAANVFSRLTPEQQKDILINNPNIVTALGEQRFDPLTNTLTLTESPFVQSQRERQEALATGLTRQLGGELPGTDPASRFESGRQLLEPAFTEERERLEQQLADQGIPRGSEAFSKELDRLEQSQGRRLQEVARESVATTEAQRAARFNEISSLLGQQQVGGVGFGQFQPQVSGLDLLGAEQAGLNRAFQAEQARKDRSAARRQALIGGLGQLGSAGIGALALSDLRLKKNIEKVGQSSSGIPIYHFDYINKTLGQFRYEGVMAQDVKDIDPDAVIEFDNGTLAVDYDKIDVNFRRVH